MTLKKIFETGKLYTDFSINFFFTSAVSRFIHTTFQGICSSEKSFEIVLALFFVSDLTPSSSCCIILHRLVNLMITKVSLSVRITPYGRKYLKTENT